MTMPGSQAQRVTPAWFDEAKLGIFIHWNPAVVPGLRAGADRLEWSGWRRRGPVRSLCGRSGP
ncbi:alpha-L-fucosidase [Nonomuraea sp. K274]|uniref:Alpha-L-fucosidase n=1 Tax=Nonomuraea cypriaca TaxID=1187855 RepID=A0A931AFZ0_9ACTN|nr:alpha-L-fucosidase [Nonomuraea cypriaca]